MLMLFILIMSYWSCGPGTGQIVPDGWWWVVVVGGEWWWVVVDGGGWWWVVVGGGVL